MTLYIKSYYRQVIDIDPDDIISASLTDTVSQPPDFKFTLVARDKYAGLATGERILVTSFFEGEFRLIGYFRIHMVEPSRNEATGRVVQFTAGDIGIYLLEKTAVYARKAFNGLTLAGTMQRITEAVTYDHIEFPEIVIVDPTTPDYPNITTENATNMLEVLTAAVTHTGYNFRVMYRWDQYKPRIEVGLFGFQRPYTFMEIDDVGRGSGYTEATNHAWLESQDIYIVSEWSAVQSDQDTLDSMFAEGGTYRVDNDSDEDQKRELLLTTSFEFGQVPDGYDVFIMQTPWRDENGLPIMAVRTDRVNTDPTRLIPPRNTRRVIFSAIVPEAPQGSNSISGVEISRAAQMLLQAAIRYFTTVASDKITMRLIIRRDVAGKFYVGDKIKLGLRLHNISLPQSVIDGGLYITSITHEWNAGEVTTTLEVSTQLEALTDPTALQYKKGNLNDRMITLKKYDFYQQRITTSEPTMKHYFPEVYYRPPMVEILSVSGASSAKILGVTREYVEFQLTGYTPVNFTIKVTPLTS